MALWPRVPPNRGRRVLYGFGSQPRPKAILFWPRPNMLQSENQCKILKTTAAKAPSCTGECVMITDGEVHDDEILCENTSGEVRNGWLTLDCLLAGMFITGCVHVCWTTSGEVRRVGLRVGRFVELDHERPSSLKHMESIRPCLSMR